MSNATETHLPNAIYRLRPDTADVDPSISNLDIDNGSLTNALNLPDAEPGFFHYLGTDAAETDDWGVGPLLLVIEGTGRRWDDHQGGGCRYYTSWEANPRIMTGDMSLQRGGYFSQHEDHQNGLEVDVRYQRTEFSTSAEQPMNLGDTTSAKSYSWERTADAMRCILADPRVIRIIYDSIDTDIWNSDIGGNGRLLHDVNRKHRDHFHVRIKHP
jgi:hypothetical protein